MKEDQLHIIKSAFTEANGGWIRFPEHFFIDKINEIEYFTEGIRGCLRVRFFIKKNEEGNYYLDLAGSNDYYSWHKRITHEGSIIQLENFLGQSGWPVYPDNPEQTKREHDEITAHNQLVQAILIKKGLERDVDNPGFESQQVVRLAYPPGS